MKQQKITRSDVLQAVKSENQLTFDLISQARKQTKLDNLTAKQRAIFTVLASKIAENRKLDPSVNVSIQEIKKSLEKDLFKNALTRGYGKTVDIITDADIFRVVRYSYGLVFGNYQDYAFIVRVPSNAKSFSSAHISGISSDLVHAIAKEKIILEEVKADTTKAVQSA